MSHRHSGHRNAPAARTPSGGRTAIRLAMMIAVIVTLASAAVWQRARLTPAWASASVRGTGQLPAPMSDETDMLGDLISRRPNSRLSCQVVLNDSLSGLKVSVAPEE